MMKKGLFGLVILSGILLSGCLKTRGELGGKGWSTSDAARGAQAQQQQNAQIDNRFYEIDKDFRQLYGKIEAIEAKVGAANEAKATEASDSTLEKIHALESRINTLEEAILSLDKRISGGKSSSLPNDSGQKVAQQPSDLPRGHFQRGEYYFSKKDYPNAIQAFERYRKQYPNGRYYSVATYNMGESFRRLNLPADAKSFYSEVVERFPKTRVARRANKKLSSIQ